jgi:hypothetical protein
LVAKHVAFETAISKNPASVRTYKGALGSPIERLRLAQRILKGMNMEDKFSYRLAVLAGYDAAKRGE